MGFTLSYWPFDALVVAIHLFPVIGLAIIGTMLPARLHRYRADRRCRHGVESDVDVLWANARTNGVPFIGLASRRIQLAFLGLHVIPALWLPESLGLLIARFGLERGPSEVNVVTTLVLELAPIGLALLYRRARASFRACDNGVQETGRSAALVTFCVQVTIVVALAVSLADARFVVTLVFVALLALVSAAHAVLLWGASTELRALIRAYRDEAVREDSIDDDEPRRGWSQLETGLWRGGTRAARDAERAGGRILQPEFRGYRRPVEYVEASSVTPDYLGYAPLAVRLAYVGMLVMPWLWPALYTGSFLSSFVGLDTMRRDPPWFVLVGFGGPLALIQLRSLFRQARGAFVDGDAQAARHGGRLAAVFAGCVAVAMTTPPLLALRGMGGPASILLILVCLLGVANLVHAILLGYCSCHLPTEWERR